MVCRWCQNGWNTIVRYSYIFAKCHCNDSDEECKLTIRVVLGTIFVTAIKMFFTVSAHKSCIEPRQTALPNS